MSYTITQAVIDMLKDWPEGEIRSLKQICRHTESNLSRHGIEDDVLETVVSARLRERKAIFGIVSVRGISKYQKKIKSQPEEGESNG